MAHKIRVNAGQKMVALPDKNVYSGPVDVTLTDAQFDQIRSELFPGVLTDLGAEVADTAGVTGADLANAVATLQDAATAATDDELAAAVATINTALTTKQDANTAATDAELAAALATVQSAATAATDSELAAAVATINTSLSSKQDAATAATDTELAAETSRATAAEALAQPASTAATDQELATAVGDKVVYVYAGANANTPRPPNAVLVVWGCNLGVVPVNAVWPDITNNKSA